MLIMTRSKWGGDAGELISLAIFDILGFANYMSIRGNEIASSLYRKIFGIINNVHEETSKLIVPSPINDDWTRAAHVILPPGNIHVSHFSDTFLIWINYRKTGFSVSGASVPVYIGNEEYKETYFPLTFLEPGTLFSPTFINEHEFYLRFVNVCMDFFCQSVNCYSSLFLW